MERLEIEKVECDQVESILESTLQLCRQVFGGDSVGLLTDDLNASRAGTKYGPFIISAKLDEEVIGFVMVSWANLMTETYTLFWLMVSPGMQNKGIATRLIQSAERLVKEELCGNRSATVVLAAEHKGTLYERLGYQGSTKNHHGAKLLAKNI